MAQEKLPLGAPSDYWMDAWQRGVLFLETLNERGNIQLAQAAKEAPIVCFCSWGNNITPAQQALDWILDLYDDVSETVANRQTIIYSLHHSIATSASSSRARWRRRSIANSSPAWR